MQQFVVPQFIDREDKILGPITVRQFLILLVTTIFLAIFYKALDFSGFALMTLFLGGSSLVLAFGKVNGRPFHFFLLNMLETVTRPRTRVWQLEIQKSKKKVQEKKKLGARMTTVVRPKEVSSSRLSELTLMVDTGGKYVPEESDRGAV